jgi:hypothetical protein
VRRRLLLALACCSVAHAAAQPRIELTATPSWKGWSRPDRSTEIDLRVSSDTATHATLEVVAGPQSVRTALELQPGQVQQLHIPVATAETLVVSATPADGRTQRLELGIARSESPLLGVGLATNERAALDGFHTVALGAQDLPRHVSAYASIDALVLDVATLAALDAAQLDALLAHAAGCGRVAVVHADARVRRLLDGAGGCGGQALIMAETPTQAVDRLAASLAASLPAALPPGGMVGHAQPHTVVWNRVALALALYFALAVLAFAFWSSLPVVVLLPAVAAALMLVLLNTMPPPSQLLVWGEAHSGARLARYQAWQDVAGVVRGTVRVPIAPQLAAAVRSCAPAQAMRFDFDAARGQPGRVEFDTRLFSQVSLCYAGSFPFARAMAVDAPAGGVRTVRNTGSHAWPPGLMLADGGVVALPPLGPGAATTIDARTAPQRGDAAVRTAQTRLPASGLAALWELELGGVAALPGGSRGWLLMSVPPP